MSLWTAETARKGLDAFTTLVEALGSVEAASEAVSAMNELPVGYMAAAYDRCDLKIEWHANPHNHCILWAH